MHGTLNMLDLNRLKSANFDQSSSYLKTSPTEANFVWVSEYHMVHLSGINQNYLLEFGVGSVQGSSGTQNKVSRASGSISITPESDLKLRV